MTKSLVIGDLHIDPYTRYGSSRFNDIKAVLDQVIKALEMNADCSALILTGDIFHSRYEIKSECLDLFNILAGRVQELGVHLVIVPGNHDMSTRDHQQTWFKNYPTLSKVTKQEGVQFYECFGLLPYEENKEKIRLNIEKIVQQKKRAIIGHVGIIEHAKRLNFEDSHAIPASWIPEHITCIMGHYHKPITLKKFPHIHFIGTPYATTWGEANLQSKRHGIWIDNKTGVILGRLYFDIPDLISCTREEYTARFTDKALYPYVRLEGGDISQVENSGNLVAVKASLKNEVGVDSINFSSFNDVLDSFLKSKSRSDRQFERLKKLNQSIVGGRLDE